MKFLGRGFQKLEPEQDRQTDSHGHKTDTDRRDRMHYYAALFEMMREMSLLIICACACVCVYRYDNEYGYSHRVVDLLNYVYKRDHA